MNYVQLQPEIAEAVRFTRHALAGYGGEEQAWPIGVYVQQKRTLCAAMRGPHDLVMIDEIYGMAKRI
jgi:hypothetical protein